MEFSPADSVNFISDNSTPAHPRIFEYLQRVNSGIAVPYGGDAVTKEFEQAIDKLFGRKCYSFTIGNGTSCNSLIMSALVSRDDAILCHAESHLFNDECNAPELFTGGAKLIPLSGSKGKLTAATITEFLQRGWQDRLHSPRPRCVSITQLSEAGTRYSAQEISDLAACCRANNLKLHLDGTRLANAVAAGNEDIRQLTHEAGVDALSLGFTKNGAMAAEAAVFFHQADAVNFLRIRKRGGQLWSKMRFISAQIIALLADDLWLHLARHANSQAQQLAEVFRAAKINIVMPVDGNHCMVELNSEQLQLLQAAQVGFYRWSKISNTYRFVTAWSTPATAITAVAKALKIDQSHELS